MLALCAMIMTVGLNASAEETPEEGWKGDVALSVTAQSGSVDTFAGAVSVGVERAWESDEVSARFTGVYGTSRDRNNDPSNNPSQDKTVQDSQGLYGDWKHTLHNRFFWRSDAELSRDSTQDREARARIATGPGYRIWQAEKPAARHFDMSAGLGYRFELYDGNTGPSTKAGTLGDLVVDNGNDQHLADAIIGFEYKNLLFGDRVDWSHTGSIAMPVNKTSAYIFTTEAIAGIPLTEAWSFRTGVFYQYVNDVPEDVNPSTLRVTIGLGYKF